MRTSGYADRSLDEHIVVADAVRALVPVMETAAQVLVAALRQERKILFCGNGGSAADAQHLAAELVGRFERERPAFPALALSVDSSALTAISNDCGFDRIFSRQIQGLGKPGDVLVAISTSGNSPNVNEGARAAREMGLHVIGLSGRDGGELRALCHECIVVPSESTARIQEMHITIGHVLCGLVEETLC